MSKKNRAELSQARIHQSDRETFNASVIQYRRSSPSQTPEEIARIERAAQEKSAAQAVRDWPESLAEKRGFKLAQSGGNQAMALAAANAYGFFGARLFMKGFAAAVGPAPYEREVSR
jgi:hypothetical protein